MGASQGELYRKCACKLEKVLSKRDCDLRILVGHSNMLQSLTSIFFLEYDEHDSTGDELGSPKVSCFEVTAGAHFIGCSEHVEDPFPVLYKVSVTETELVPSD